MEYEDYIKQNPDFTNRARRTNAPEAAKSYSTLTTLKFLFFAIATGFLAMLTIFGSAFIYPQVGAVSLALGLLSLIFSILSISYVVALGVYIGSNSK